MVQCLGARRVWSWKEEICVNLKQRQLARGMARNFDGKIEVMDQEVRRVHDNTSL